MKNKLMAGLAVSVLAMGVSAAVHADAHPYVGLSAGYFNAGSGDFNGQDEEGTGGLQLGYHFNNDWSIEANHSEGFNTSNPHTRVAGLTGAYRLLGEETQLLGLAAIQNINNPNDGDDVDFALGAAVSHYFTDNIEGRVTVLAGVSNEYYTSNLSLNYHFGTHAEADVAEEPAPQKVEPAVVMTKTLRVNFDNDSSVVLDADREEIRAVSESMKNNPGSTATLVGHTDSNASDEYNQALSERRAAAVKAAMVDDGVSAADVEESGRGESEPVADNATRAGRAENRRVEAVVTGIKQ
jgi:outer membrane protein OmpA-like peptidoglycan-associated protein